MCWYHVAKIIESRKAVNEPDMKSLGKLGNSNAPHATVQVLNPQLDVQPSLWPRSMWIWCCLHVPDWPALYSHHVNTSIRLSNPTGRKNSLHRYLRHPLLQNQITGKLVPDFLTAVPSKICYHKCFPQHTDQISESIWLNPNSKSHHEWKISLLILIWLWGQVAAVHKHATNPTTV